MAKKQKTESTPTVSESLLLISSIIMVIYGAFAITALSKAKEEKDTSIISPIASGL
ncbi:hypothetical protein [Paenibacillus paeoniae]|uniref:hypothetical protein n=1 Tax=Paenibacillus paeoniae TaxID=2292705 RepID=UPI001401E0E3|nr:hypothetical protein [Paenibacillus paeoniae]